MKKGPRDCQEETGPWSFVQLPAPKLLLHDRDATPPFPLLPFQNRIFTKSSVLQPQMYMANRHASGDAPFRTKSP